MVHHDNGTWSLSGPPGLLKCPPPVPLTGLHRKPTLRGFGGIEAKSLSAMSALAAANADAAWAVGPKAAGCRSADIPFSFIKPDVRSWRTAINQKQSALQEKAGIRGMADLLWALFHSLNRKCAQSILCSLRDRRAADEIC